MEDTSTDEETLQADDKCERASGNTNRDELNSLKIHQKARQIANTCKFREIQSSVQTVQTLTSGIKTLKIDINNSFLKTHDSNQKSNLCRLVMTLETILDAFRIVLSRAIH